MGAAVAKNTSNMMAAATQNVSSNTVNNVTQGSSCTEKVILNNCTVYGDLTQQNVCDAMNQASIFVNSTMNTSVVNDLAQKLAQDAQSEVGALGVGFSDSSNYVSQVAQASTNIQHAVANDVYITDFNKANFQCNHSTIYGNLTILNENRSAFVSSVVTQNSTISNLSDSISQSVQQSVSAKVQGLTFLLLVLLLMVCAVGYFFYKPLEIIADNRLFLYGGLTALGVLVVILAYMFKWPPYFNDLPVVRVYGSLNTTGDALVDQRTYTATLSATPLRYYFPLAVVPNERSPTVDMLHMAIASVPGGGQISKDSHNAALVQWERFRTEVLSRLADGVMPQSWAASDDLAWILPNQLMESTSSSQVKLHTQVNPQAEADFFAADVQKWTYLPTGWTGETAPVWQLRRFALASFLATQSPAWDVTIHASDDPFVDKSVPKPQLYVVEVQGGFTDTMLINGAGKQKCTVTGAFGTLATQSYHIRQLSKTAAWWVAGIFVLLLVVAPHFRT